MINVIYHQPDGRILACKTIQPGMEELASPGDCSWFETQHPINPVDTYVVPGVLGPELFSRPLMPITHDGLTITTAQDLLVMGAPDGSVLHHPDGSEPVDSEGFTWGCDVPGIYILRIEKFPYQEALLRVEVNPA